MREETPPENFEATPIPAGEPSSEKSVLEYTTETGEMLQEKLGDYAIFLDRSLATSNLNPREKARLTFKLGLALDYLRAGMVNEARHTLTMVGMSLQINKSVNGFYLINMKTNRQEVSTINRQMGTENRSKGFLSFLWRGGKK